VPHGGGPNPRPIFRGSNDPAYQILAGWVNSLRSKTTANMASEADNSGGNEPFAASRPGRGVVSTDSVPMPVRPSQAPAPDRAAAGAPRSNVAVQTLSLPEGQAPSPPGRMIPESAVGLAPNPSPGTEFPVPYLQGGPPPTITRGGAAAPVSIPMPQVPGATRAPATPDSLPALSPLPSPAAKNDAGSAAASPVVVKTGKKRKPVTIDPALLEQALRARNQTP